MRSSVFNDMKDYLKSQYSIPKKSVEEAVKMDVTFTFKGDDDSDTRETVLYAVNIDGDWYIVDSVGNFIPLPMSVVD